MLSLARTHAAWGLLAALIITPALIDEMFDIQAEGIRLTTEDLKHEGLWSAA